MNFEQYSDFVGLFNGILKNTPVNSAVYKTHYELVFLRIKNIEVFIACFKKHIFNSDWFPTHVDLFNHLEEVEKEIRQEAEKSNPVMQEYKKLKILEIEQGDEFMLNRDKKLIDSFRDKLLNTQKKIEEMKLKYPFLNNFKD